MFLKRCANISYNAYGADEEKMIKSMLPNMPMTFSSINDLIDFKYKILEIKNNMHYDLRNKI